MFYAARRALETQRCHKMSQEGGYYNFVEEIIEFLTKHVNLHQFTTRGGKGTKHPGTRRNVKDNHREASHGRHDSQSMGYQPPQHESWGKRGKSCPTTDHPRMRVGAQAPPPLVIRPVPDTSEEKERFHRMMTARHLDTIDNAMACIVVCVI